MVHQDIIYPFETVTASDDQAMSAEHQERNKLTADHVTILFFVCRFVGFSLLKEFKIKTIHKIDTYPSK